MALKETKRSRKVASKRIHPSFTGLSVESVLLERSSRLRPFHVYTLPLFSANPTIRPARPTPPLLCSSALAAPPRTSHTHSTEPRPAQHINFTSQSISNSQRDPHYKHVPNHTHSSNSNHYPLNSTILFLHTPQTIL